MRNIENCGGRLIFPKNKMKKLITIRSAWAGSWSKVRSEHSGHNGGITGFASAFLYLPDTQTTGIVLLNANHIENPHQIALDIITQLRQS